MELYDYQKQFIAGIYKSFRASRSVLGVSPTGSGKTFMGAAIAHQTYRQRKRLWFCAPLDPLIDQTIEEFVLHFVGKGTVADRIGVIHPGYKPIKDYRKGLGQVVCDYSRPIQVVAQATVDRRLKSGKIPREHFPDIVIFDECHTSRWHSSANRIIQEVNPRFEIGLTGTPCRMSPYESFSQYYDDAIFAPSTAELTDMGRLAPLRAVEAVDYADFERVSKANGVLDEEKVKLVYTSPEAIARMFKISQQYCRGEKAIGFCVDLEHARDCCEYWNRHGVYAEYITYKTSRNDRRDIIARFKSGETRVLFGRDVLSIGFNVKDVIKGLFMRPTQSKALWIQQLGRIRRTAPGKEYGMAIDFVGNFSRHGDGSDVWLKTGDGTRSGVLDPPANKGDAQESPFLVACQAGCGHLMAWQSKTCAQCGAEQVREAKDRPQERSFDAVMIETVMPSRLDPGNEQHAIRYYRYLRAVAVLRWHKLPGLAYFKIMENAEFKGWLSRMPRGRSAWTIGAIFQSSKVETAEQYYGFLVSRYAIKDELTPAQRQQKVWAQLEQEFTDPVLVQLRQKLLQNRGEALKVEVPVAAVPKVRKPPRTVQKTW